MDGSIALQPKDRKILLEMYRKSLDPAIRLRAHVVLLLADDYPWRLVVRKVSRAVQSANPGLPVRDRAESQAPALPTLLLAGR